MTFARLPRPLVAAVLAVVPVLGPASFTRAEPVAGPATEPATRPVDRPPLPRESRDRGLNRPEREGGAMGGGGGNRGDNRPGGPGGWRGGPISAEEWKLIEAFLKENSPQRLEMYNAAVARFGTEDERVKLARGAAAARYRMLHRFQEENSDLYKQGLEQLHREDEIWGLVKAVQHDANNVDAREKLSAKVRESVTLVLAERRARLERIKQNLENEQKALAEDEGRLDDLVERQVKRYVEGGVPDENRDRRRPDREGGRPDRGDRPERPRDEGAGNPPPPQPAR